MGCDCNVNLPANVRVKDVATVLAILAGKKVRLEPISDKCQSPVARVEGVKVETTCIPEMVMIPRQWAAGRGCQGREGRAWRRGTVQLLPFRVRGLWRGQAAGGQVQRLLDRGCEGSGGLLRRQGGLQRLRQQGHRLPEEGEAEQRELPLGRQGLGRFPEADRGRQAADGQGLQEGREGGGVLG